MARDPNCIFCKIVAGDIPSLKVLETDAALAFLDIGPLAEGHVLLIPRDHHLTLLEMPDDAVAELARLLPRLARAVQAATGADARNILQNNGRASGQEVPHVNIHIIPRRPADGLGYRWNAGTYPQGRAEALQARLGEALGNDKR